MDKGRNLLAMRKTKTHAWIPFFAELESAIDRMGSRGMVEDKPDPYLKCSA